MQQNGVTRTAQRAATFHPIGGINEFDFFVISARAQTGGEVVHFSIRHEPFNVALLLLGEGPKALANGKSWARAFEVLGGKRFPRRRGSFFRDAAHRLGLFDVLALVETVRERAMVIMIRSTIRTVVRPGRSDPLAADASDKLSRMRSCAGFPMTVWSRSRI